MSGQFDSPDERRARDAAAGREPGKDLVAAGVEVEVVERDRLVTNPYGRRYPGPRTASAMVASAARLNINDRRTVEDMRRRRQGWQTEAWDYFDEVGEIAYTTTFVANLMSKLRLYPAIQSPDGPVGVDAVHDDGEAGTDARQDLTDVGITPEVADLAVATLGRLRSLQGGQSALLRELSLNLEIAGEALDVDTLVATPDGFARMGDLRAGDTVLAGDGRPCRVLIAHPVRFDRPCFEVRLSGGVKVVADAEHLWLTHQQRDRAYAQDWGRAYEPTVITTEQMASTVKARAASGTAANHAIELAHIVGADPVLGAPVDPYVLGYWLGDGTAANAHMTVHPDDQPNLREHVEAAGYGWAPSIAPSGRGFRVNILGLHHHLRQMELLGHKRIPGAYLRHTEQARWALLQGLIDSDGHVDKKGRVEFSNRNPELLWGVAELAASLGLRPSMPGRHRLWFNSAGQPVATLSRKAARITPAKERDRWRYVQAVEQVKSRPVRCITVDSDDQTFLVTPFMVRTHNCYIHGHQETEGDPDPGGWDDPEDSYDPSLIEDWNIRSVDELIPSGEEFVIRRGPGTKMGSPLPDGDLIIRIWERHPRFSEMATCAMRRVLSEAESLLLLSREVRATAKSRLSNGILLIPSELSFGSVDPTADEGDGEETSDPFDDELEQAMITPIQEEGSASAVVPLVLRGPAELLQHVNHLALDKTLDPVLDTRIEQRILRIARGLNMPAEVTTGLMATTFANAVQVKRSEFEDHIEPRAVLVCDAITSGYFQWALEQAGVAPEVAREIFCWFDASALIQVEDMSEMAVKAHEDGVISDAARRRYSGFTEEDAPDDEEILRRLLLRGGRMDPTIEGYLFRATGLAPTAPIPAPPAGVLGETTSQSAMPAQGTPVAVAAPTSAAPITLPASGHRPAGDGWAKLGGQLVAMDRELRTRIIAKLDQAMRNALERAGQRIKAQLPPRDKGGAKNPLLAAAETVTLDRVAATLGRAVLEAAGVAETDLIEGAFEGALDDIRAWIEVAYDRAVRAVERCAGPTPPARRAELDANHARNTDTAVAWLRDNLHALAAERLYTPTVTTEPAGEHDGTVLIPASLVRAAMAVAGGAAVRGGTAQTASAWLQLGGAGPVTAGDGSPLGGVAAGQDMMTAVGAAGASVEGWQWEYGAGMRSEFQPHLDLDGTIVATTDDPAWANQDSFPPTDFYYPGDHDGCFPAGTVVEGPLPVGATLRDWQGEMVEIRLASGELLAATPNHPVLTRRGWVPIGGLDEGDEVVRCIDAERITDLVPNGYQMPAGIEEVADTFGVHSGMGTARVKVAAENFHGDGAGSEIAVVGANRDLWDGINAALGKPASESPFPFADPRIGPSLPRQSGTAAGVETVRPTPFGRMGGGDNLGAPLDGTTGVEDALLLGHGPDSNPGGDQPARYRLAGSADALSENLDRLTRFVAADKVIHVERYAFSGHVYNLDTRVEWYIANGILVRNCVCDIVPVILGPEGMATESISDLGVMDEARAGADEEAALAETGSEEEAAAADETVDEAGYATVAPHELADELGYTEGHGDITEEDLAAAKAGLREARQKVQDAAAVIAEDHLSLLGRSDVYSGEKGKFPYIYDPATRAKRGDTGTGLYDWFDELAPKEKSRLRAWMENRNEQTEFRSGIDEIAQALAPVFGMGGGTGGETIDEYSVMKRWVQETRIIDAAQAVANNRAINPDRYGGLDINAILDTPYDLKRLFGGNEAAAEELARANTGEAYDEATHLLGSPYGRVGTSPWEMTEAEYVAEAQRLEARIGQMAPVSDDEFDGPTYSREDQAALNRMAELAPPGVDDGTEPWQTLYREILRTARYGGLI